MNRPLQLLAILWTLASSCSASDFDHWYFNALLKGGTTTVRFIDKTGNEKRVTTGTRQGKLSDEGDAFVETGEQSGGADQEKETYRIQWTKTAPRSYLGLMTNSRKLTAKITLKIKSETFLEFQHLTSSKYSFLELARLQSDGRIYFQSTGFHTEATEQSYTIISWFKPNTK